MEDSSNPIATKESSSELESSNVCFSHWQEHISCIYVLYNWESKNRMYNKSCTEGDFLEMTLNLQEIVYVLLSTTECSLCVVVMFSRWLSLRMEFVGGCVIFFASLFAVISRNSIATGLVGLSITYALQVTKRLCAYRAARIREAFSTIFIHNISNAFFM